MREPPLDLSDDTLRSAVSDRYGRTGASVTFLPLGHDSSAWVYRVQAADCTPYFLKVRKSVANPSSLLVPRYLYDHGVMQVIAPLPTIGKALWTEAGGYALILYPFVDGVTGMDHGLSEGQWVEYGAVARRIHTTPIAPELAQTMRRESFVPVGAAMVREVDTHIGERDFKSPETQELAAFWRKHRALILTLTEQAEELGRRLARRALPLVLCHADFHTANVLLDARGQVWIVDWDEAILAPRERDLMFAVGGGISRMLVGPRQERRFLQGYGDAAIDPLALGYYRYAWAVNDIGDYGHQVLMRPDLGAISRRAAADIFVTLFRPGEIVTLALAAGE
jgi:spectinomycin phosphotransferase